MHPYLFRIAENFAIPTYGVMAALGLVMGLSILLRYARKQGLNPDKTWNLAIVAVLSAIVGAKLLFVIDSWSRFSSHLDQLFSFSTLQTGGVWLGGLVAAIAMCLIYVLRNHMPVLKTADVFAPAIAIGHAFGRAGCLAAGCCYGRPTDLPWAIRFVNPLANQIAGTPLNVYLHPTQIYEGLLELANFFLLSWLLMRKRWDGQVAGAYMVLYGVGRFVIEFFRGDQGRGSFFDGLSNTQVISIVLVISGAALWIRWKKPSPKPASPAAA